MKSTKTKPTSSYFLNPSAVFMICDIELNTQLRAKDTKNRTTKIKVCKFITFICFQSFIDNAFSYVFISLITSLKFSVVPSCIFQKCVGGNNSEYVRFICIFQQLFQIYAIETEYVAKKSGKQLYENIANAKNLRVQLNAIKYRRAHIRKDILVCISTLLFSTFLNYVLFILSGTARQITLFHKKKQNNKL